MTPDPSDLLEDLKFVQTADVYKAGRRAGRLRRHTGGVEFSYFSDYRDDGGPSVATTLPVGQPSWWRGSGAVPAFFAGLLPEGRRLSALRRSVKTSADDELTMLLAVGEDAVGDVQVVPEGATPGRVPPRIEVSSFDQVRFAVNGQVVVPAGGQLKVPTPRVDQRRFVAVPPFVRASRMR